ncbi:MULTISPECIES: hypothetical protein [Acinetobacter]|uniref:hypothetical protein n=1 Tax=Acinetobacter TaxID=469 RepID=UPI0002CE925F|nr:MULTISPECIES: hypothetical protein [Acinetobacter]ENX29123.1 hypothetical protein F890_02225 [Acinetobacter sp. CIP 64.7]
MKKILVAGVVGILSAYSSAEIVKNSKGEKIELKSNGTWVLIPRTAADFVNDGESYVVQIEDGNKKLTDVTVSTDITLMGVGRQLTKEEMLHNIKMTSLTAQFKLKNRFSYKPREVRITQKGKDVSIRISHTGENSYGADVAGYYESTYYIEDSGKLKLTSKMY